jgi:hypothetical protein
MELIDVFNAMRLVDQGNSFKETVPGLNGDYRLEYLGRDDAWRHGRLESLKAEWTTRGGGTAQIFMDLSNEFSPPRIRFEFSVDEIAIGFSTDPRVREAFGAATEAIIGGAPSLAVRLGKARLTEAKRARSEHERRISDALDKL